MLKKFIALVAIVFAITAGTATQAQVLDKIALYIPNRIVDTMDIFSISLAFGPTARGEVWCTRPFAFGAGTGILAKVAKGYNRQYGCGLESGSETNFAPITSEAKQVVDSVGSMKDYDVYYTGAPNINERVYNFHEGARDYYSIGMTGGLALFEVSGEFHPVEIADFFSGFLFIDLKGDDFSFADISN
jgi:hypothetical protein